MCKAQCWPATMSLRTRGGVGFVWWFEGGLTGKIYSRSSQPRSLERHSCWALCKECAIYKEVSRLSVWNVLCVRTEVLLATR